MYKRQPSDIHLSRYAAAFSAAFKSGITRGLLKRSSIFICSADTGPIEVVYAFISIPSSERNFFATAPAATLHNVSLPEERPPPL